jgi:LmbE family N-acetylglucosaminyl deacetylase
MKTILIISPHPDDAVLSCGASIAALCAKGCNVVTATVFTHPGNAVNKAAHYTERRAQDQQALRMLGAGCIHMGFTDAPFRNHTWNNFSTLLFHHHTPPHQLPLVQDIAAAIHRLIQEWQPQEVWYPLGAGGHIDHQLVWHSSKLLSHLPQQQVYYEERPYAMVPGWAAIRWHSTGATARQYTAGNAPGYSLITAIPLAFIGNYIADEQDRQASITAWNNEWQLLPRFPGTVTQWQQQEQLFTQQPVHTSVIHFQQQCQAIACYATEWPALFGPQQQHIHTALSQNIHNHQYCEQYWYKN